MCRQTIPSLLPSARHHMGQRLFNPLSEPFWVLLLSFIRGSNKGPEMLDKFRWAKRNQNQTLFCSRPSCPPASDVYPSLTPALHYPDDRFFPGGSLPLLTQGPHGPPSQQPERAHLTVAVASEFGDEADVVVSNLDHLLADVVLRADTALGARPPGQRIIGSERVLALGAWWDRLLPLTSCSWCLDKAAKPLGGNKR